MKKYNQFILTVLLLFFTLQAKAVYEGRDKNLEQYQSIRNQVELAPVNTGNKAYADPDPGGEPGSGDGVKDDELPITDSPLFFFLLGGITCGAYIFNKKRKISHYN